MGDAEKALDLHIELRESEPHIWRDLRVPAGIGLPDLHRAIQLSFGWEDRHTHLFSLAGAGRRIFAGDEETALELGVELAADFTLADALHGRKSTLVYEYDLCGGWQHEITVTGHAVMPSGYLSCLAGANRGPIEDSGGPGGSRGVCGILTDPADPGHGSLRPREAPGEVLPGSDPAGFDLDRVNLRLARLSVQLTGAEASAEEKAEVLRPVAWLLERTGAEGLELTRDGYLKPAVVRAAAQVLGWADEPSGKSCREARTRPVRELRTRLQDWGLLRKFKGRLIRTPAGRALSGPDREDRLWDYLADRLAHPGSEPGAFLNGFFARWLLSGPLPAGHRRGQLLADVLEAAGYRLPGDVPVPEEVGTDLARELDWTFRVLNLFLPGNCLPDRDEASVAGAKFLVEILRRQEAGPDRT
ncbi:plasmid pRiA4b ORF-3 family protein [Arthrobacter sp. GCM10027362]|uniref:plasmid pRiA4b ORF-3 family protein n=1 Tax=Arthrobacter sp. GCM10027362 TaxID=3273379 RepID=UPI0036405199